MKSEPREFSLEDLKKAPRQTDCWDGVRNYQARNFMRESMKVGELVLFYHSSASPPGIAGLAEIAKEAYPDPTAFDKTSKHYDPQSNPKAPRWLMVDVKFKETFPHFVSLKELREQPLLKKMTILQKGNRLSITPVTKTEFDHILTLGRA